MTALWLTALVLAFAAGWLIAAAMAASAMSDLRLRLQRRPHDEDQSYGGTDD